MYEHPIVALLAEVAAADPSVCDRDALAELVTKSQRVRSWLDALDASIAWRGRRLADDGRCESPGSLLAGAGRRAAKDAEAAARRAGACDQLPSFHDALAAGDVAAGHVDALARLAGDLDDAGRSELRTLEGALLGSAKTMPVEEFARECRDLSRILSRDEGRSRLAQLKQARRLKRWFDRVTGMCHTHLELDPETDAKVSAALAAAVAAERAKEQSPDTKWDQLQADALVGLITGAQSLDQRVPEVSVLIDLDTLLNGLHEASVCETADGNPLPPDTVRRLGCDAEIVPVVLNGEGVALDVGREQRLATRSQRRALRAMYRTCAHSGCQVGFEQCRIHHVVWWERGGPSDLANLLPLCSAHHHLVHEGGWNLSLREDRTITLRRPDDTVYFEGSTVDRTTPAAPNAERERARPGEQEIPLHLRRRARPADYPNTTDSPEKPNSAPEPAEAPEPYSRDETWLSALFDPEAVSPHPLEFRKSPKATDRPPTAVDYHGATDCEPETSLVDAASPRRGRAPPRAPAA